MKLSALVCLLLFVALRSVNAQTLGDLQKIQIVIEGLDNKAKKAGITEDCLSDLVLVALKRDVPRLKVVNDAPNGLYVNINTLELVNGMAANVEVSVVRLARIKGDSGSEIYHAVVVWNEGMMFKWPLETFASQLRDHVNELVTKFAAQYYKHNP